MEDKIRPGWPRVGNGKHKQRQANNSLAATTYQPQGSMSPWVPLRQTVRDPANPWGWGAIEDDPWQWRRRKAPIRGGVPWRVELNASGSQTVQLLLNEAWRWKSCRPVAESSKLAQLPDAKRSTHIL